MNNTKPAKETTIKLSPELNSRTGIVTHFKVLERIDGMVVYIQVGLPTSQLSELKGFKSKVEKVKEYARHLMDDMGLSHLQFA